MEKSEIYFLTSKKMSINREYLYQTASGFSNAGYVPNNSFPTLNANRAVSSVLSPPPIIERMTMNSPIYQQPRLTPNLIPSASSVTPLLDKLASSSPVREMVEIVRVNNDANFFSDQLMKHIDKYGDSAMLWPMIADKTFEMQDLILMKTAFHFAVRGDLLKMLVPIGYYAMLGEPGINRRNKHLKQVAHFLKHLERSDMIENIRERFEGLLFD